MDLLKTQNIIVQVSLEELQGVISEAVTKAVAEVVDQKESSRQTMSVEDLAMYLGVGKQTAQRICRENPSFACKPGKRWFISRKRLDEAVANGSIR